MQGRDMSSKLYLTQYTNNWVKLRYSYEEGMKNKGEEIFQKFLAELSAILEKAAEKQVNVSHENISKRIMVQYP